MEKHGEQRERERYVERIKAGVYMNMFAIRIFIDHGSAALSVTMEALRGPGQRRWERAKAS